MPELGLKLLRLQEEFARRQEDEALAAHLPGAGLTLRSEEEIAADYEAALLELLSRRV